MLFSGRLQTFRHFFGLGMLVLSTGQGVHGFTLDPGVGEFLLSHPDMRIPEQGHIYSVNEGNWKKWDAPARDAVNWFHGCETSDGKPYSSRYVGALVADFHRTLINGGIYMPRKRASLLITITVKRSRRKFAKSVKAAGSGGLLGCNNP